jgi:hypothetical protein
MMNRRKFFTGIALSCIATVIPKNNRSGVVVDTNIRCDKLGKRGTVGWTAYHRVQVVGGKG